MEVIFVMMLAKHDLIVGVVYIAVTSTSLHLITMAKPVVSSVKTLRGPDFDPATQSKGWVGSILDSEHIGSSLLKVTDLDAAVKTLHIVACKNEFNEPEQGGEIGNHWFSPLELEDDQSVSLDMMGGDGAGRIGLLLLESHEGRVATYEEVHRTSIDVAGEQTVRHFLECLIEKGRERYRFTPEITGCRWWNLVAVGDWEEAEIIEAGNLDRVEMEISRYWDSEGREDGILEMTKGDFY
jgi:hypothetical protein